MKYKAFILKRNIENVFILPFVLLGKVIAMFKPLKEEYEHFYFFPFYHIGGAEKVHYQIAEVTNKGSGIIFITKKSLNNLYYEQFLDTGCRLVDVSKYTDNKYLYFNNLIFRGIISYYINTQKRKSLVFNGQCNFGYKLSPWVNKNIPQLELIHSLCSFSYIRIPFINYYYKTVMISKKRVKDHEDLYDRYNIPAFYKSRIVFILNGIVLPPHVKTTVNENEPLKVLYVGRDTEEKRVHLIAAVAKAIEDKNISAEFIFMGEVKNAIPAELHSYCTFLGNQNDEEKIDAIYMQADVLLMLSTTEGFPMAIMESMARGLAIVSTDVGEIPYHVQSNVNGYLIDNPADNDHVFKAAVNHITEIANNRNLLTVFRDNNISHAQKHFSLQRFSNEYNQLFTESKQHFDQ
jgi:glycosyltransferase involved in cell wall biosynthesis